MRDIYPDATIPNADWPKRTPDTMDDLTGADPRGTVARRVAAQVGDPAARSVVASAVAWHAGWETAVKEWQAAEDQGGHEAAPPAVAALLGHAPPLTDPEKAAFRARTAAVQTTLRRQGITKLTLWRPLTADQARVARVGQALIMRVYALSAWTRSRDQAARQTAGGVLARAVVPVEDVWMIASVSAPTQRPADRSDDVVILSKHPTIKVGVESV